MTENSKLVSAEEAPKGEIAVKVEDATLLCGEVEASCICHEPSGHEGAHECYDKTCNGAWENGPDGFKIVRLPWLSAPVDFASPFSALLGLGWGDDD
jgi:hypothetical protein